MVDAVAAMVLVAIALGVAALVVSGLEWLLPVAGGINLMSIGVAWVLHRRPRQQRP